MNAIKNIRSSHPVITGVLRFKGSSSQRWLDRQRRDPYVRQARIQSYRCRSAFKLLELNKALGGLIKPGMVVVDCGAAPGSWTQVAVELAAAGGGGGAVVALDLKDFDPVPGATCLAHVDLRDTAKTIKAVRDALRAPRCVDVVLGDIAPPASGLPHLDHPNLIHLAECVLQLALRVSKPGASLLVKLWDCPEVAHFKHVLERFYLGPGDSSPPSSASVRVLKPAASRKDSAELYICARGFCLTPPRATGK